MRVLIIKTSSLGDIIHALPVLDYLHRAAPGIEIGWVVEENFAGILEGNPLLSHLHLVATKRWRKSLLSSTTRREIVTAIREIRSCGYDTVFDIQGNFKSGLICLASGVSKRIGLHRKLLQESFNALCTNIKAPIVPEDGKHIIPRCLSVVHVPFQLPYRDLELVTDIPTSAEEDRIARTILAPFCHGPRLLFHYGTTWQTKFWSMESWIALGKLACQAYPSLSILLSWGTEAEKAAVDAIASAIGPRATVLERVSLKQLTAILKQVDLVVGGDTGPTHLAAAVGTPTVSLYRSSDGEYSGPRGKHHIIIQSPMECTRCFRTKCPRDEECRASITPRAMFQAIQKQLHALAESR